MRDDLAIYYGLANERNLRDCVRIVCDLLGNGENRTAPEMLLETAAAETHSGHLLDSHTTKHGVGVFQIDRIAFDDVVARTRLHDINAIRDVLGIDIRIVQYEFLAFSPLLSAIFCRLFYKLIPDVFPTNVVGRAQYWKKFYNTEKGAGSVNGYLNKVEMWKVTR